MRGRNAIGRGYKVRVLAKLGKVRGRLNLLALSARMTERHSLKLALRSVRLRVDGMRQFQAHVLKKRLPKARIISGFTKCRILSDQRRLHVHKFQVRQLINGSRRVPASLQLSTPHFYETAVTLHIMSRRSLSAEMEDMDNLADDEPQSRREELFAPIVTVCQALGGYEETIGDDGEAERVYRLGDECLGEANCTLKVRRG